MSKQFILEAKRMQKLAGITEAKVVPIRMEDKNKDLKLFKSYIDKGDIKKAAKLYYGTGAITGKDAQNAMNYVKFKKLKKQFDKLDPDFDPAGGHGLSSYI